VERGSLADPAFLVFILSYIDFFFLTRRDSQERGYGIIKIGLEDSKNGKHYKRTEEKEKTKQNKKTPYKERRKARSTPKCVDYL